MSGLPESLISLNKLYGATFLFLNISKQVSIYILVLRGRRQHCFADKLATFCGLQNYTKHFIDMVVTRLWWDSHFCVNTSLLTHLKLYSCPVSSHFLQFKENQIDCILWEGITGAWLISVCNMVTYTVQREVWLVTNVLQKKNIDIWSVHSHLSLVQPVL